MRTKRACGVNAPYGGTISAPYGGRKKRCGKAIGSPYGGTISSPYGGKKQRCGKAIGSPYGGMMMRPHTKKMLHEKLDRALSMPTRERVGGFIFPVIGGIINAVRASKAKKAAAKKATYEASPEGKQARLKEIQSRGEQDRLEKEAYERGLKGGRMRIKK